MNTDRLDALLRRFSLTARMFHSGPLCGIVDFSATEGLGQLHLIKRGPVQVRHGARRQVQVLEPSVVFYPRPFAHRFTTDSKRGADMACAYVTFNGGAAGPIAQALPPVMVIPLAELQEAGAVLELLFVEAFGQKCGRQQVVNRLFEVVVVHILRFAMDRMGVDQGLLAGLAHPRIARAMIALHDKPADAWTLPRLARHARMSRSHFVAVFRDTVGVTPGDYLARYRISVAQDMLRQGDALKLIAGQVGYSSTAALSRAFKSVCGSSPRQWKAAAADMPPPV